MPSHRRIFLLIDWVFIIISDFSTLIFEILRQKCVLIVVAYIYYIILDSNFGYCQFVTSTFLSI